MDLTTLIHGQVTRMTPELVPPLFELPHLSTRRTFSLTDLKHISSSARQVFSVTEARNGILVTSQWP
ncbi:hypothetical protein TNCV_4599211 [Trichonephila clavipes]|nr:hypothetical protein TNCV_4599211 [Trichonephila clavipes]